jgi:hypothetical protein
VSSNISNYYQKVQQVNLKNNSRFQTNSFEKTKEFHDKVTNPEYKLDDKYLRKFEPFNPR